jgi:hypothetical protein
MNVSAHKTTQRKEQDNMKIQHILASMAVLTLLSGCGQSGSPTTAELPSDAGQGALDALIVESVAGEPVGPLAARSRATAGDDVVLTGHIAGRAEPFVAGRAMFTLVDTQLPLCDDHCSVPWDMCCEAPEDVVAASATVQVVGDDGTPVKQSLKGLLAPGQEIVIAGTVNQNDEYSFVVNAETIAVVR